MLDPKNTFYHTYRQMMGKVYRTVGQMEAVTNAGNAIVLRHGALVEVVDANQVGEVRYGKVGTGKQSYHGVVEDGVRLTVVLLGSTGARLKTGTSSEGVFASMLEPEPGVVTWPHEFSRRANLMGWDVFFCDGSEGPLWQIQAVYDEGRFLSPDNKGAWDEAAWKFVWEKAVGGEDEVCLAALAFLKHRCPAEYEAIRKHCLGKAAQ